MKIEVSKGERQPVVPQEGDVFYMTRFGDDDREPGYYIIGQQGYFSVQPDAQDERFKFGFLPLDEFTVFSNYVYAGKLKRVLVEIEHAD